MRYVILAFVLAVAIVTAQAMRADLEIVPAFPTIAVSESVQLTARSSSTGQILNAKWSISDPLVANLTTSGLVTGRTAGMTVIRAQVKNLKAETTVTVTGPPPPPQEICGNGLDDDGDGLIDENPPCASSGGDGRGPQSTIACPVGSQDVFPGQSIQSALNSSLSVCLRAGTHVLTTPIYPRANQIITGEFGAFIDGTNAMQSFDVTGTTVVSGWNCANCTNVTVRNLRIKGRDTINCVGAYGASAGGWTVDHNEIFECRWGVNFGRYWEGTTPENKLRVVGPTITANLIHHNVMPGATGSDGSGAYGFQNTDGGSFVNNELSFNGGQAKWTGTIRSRAADNFVHHNGVGLWWDGDNLDAVAENNLIEDNCADGIFYEISARGTIRNNIIRRNGHSCAGSGIFVSTSREVEIHSNTLEDNFRDVNLFVNCFNVIPSGTRYPTQIEWDLRDVSVHDNTIRVGGPEFTVWGPSWGWSTCSEAQVAFYSNPNNKRLHFVSNHYTVSTLSGFWWYWDGFKTWAQWQALGHDLTGSVQ